jgi:hypothetical protein
MLGPLLIGCVTIVLNMGIQIMAVVMLIRYLARRLNLDGIGTRYSSDTRILSVVVIFLLAGHLLQFLSWALLFMFLGEFSDFATAFYHSTVNFASLGYGDIVMSEKWRLLGALEAANGVLMFGLSAGTILTAMQRMFNRNKQELIDLDSKD